MVMILYQLPKRASISSKTGKFSVLFEYYRVLDKTFWHFGDWWKASYERVLHDRSSHGPNPCTAKTFPPMGQPPPEINMHILCSPMLSLYELAQVAVTCKFFWEVYRERCTLEEAWLEQSATSAFSNDVTHTLPRWLARLKQNRERVTPPQNAGARPIFDLAQGGQLPDERTLLSLRFAGLRTTVQGLLAAGQGAPVFWTLAAPKAASVSLVSHGRNLLTITYGTHKKLNIIIRPSSPAQVVPFLGLVHLACKHIAAAERRKVGLRGWQLPPRQLVRFVSQTNMNVSPWNNADTIGVDDQRALSVLHMWNRRFGSGIP
eukprot:jgi/Botrbrau1/15518/Bobra.0225s0008.1